MPGGKKRTNTRARDPVTGRFCAAPKPQPPDPVTAAKSVPEEQYNVLLDKTHRDKEEYLEELKREKSKFEQKEKEVEELEREVARLTENSRDIDRQRQELENKYLKEFEQQKQDAEEIKQEQERRVACMQAMVREHGLEENCDIAWDGNFKEKLKREFRDRRSNCYTSVKVLIVRWASDDLGLSRPVENLARVFEQSYKFNSIGDDSPDTLLIFVYVGHGNIENKSHDAIWSGRDGGPRMPSSGIQTLLEESKSDALLLYDTCHSANTAISLNHSAGSVTELIAACGFETTTRSGDNSFTSALIQELYPAATQGAVSVSELYNRVLTRQRNSPNRKKNATPVRCTLASDGYRTSIMLEPLLPALVTASHQSSELSDGANTVYNIGIVKRGLRMGDTSVFLKWLLRAPSDVIDVQLRRINIQKQTSSNGGLESSNGGHES
ncbi:putative tyrosine-protein phosphatase non-receptor type 6 protein [Botrytis fragariae]|uniref:Putative tyrosine-protein phosphatase non-receptor type 6 protein n=1 Tax=Botrytis fragariae TaxID=1964551 RepID=A0A8H6AI32_9HELO|nr:putative tyrosine-protein phosphatase non-receptor type 6 protein [Botrytis fragariae]KAF5867726.1 putative tyrosine-protein phosphatase non-receptor type 6 protein [Botrytis fragariae]